MSFDPSNPTHRSARKRYAEAFKEQANIIGLAGFFALSAATLNPIPLLVGLVAEAIYMIFVPDSKWFMKRLEKKFDDEVRRRREELKAQVFPQVKNEIRERFARLESTRTQIEAQSKSEDVWFREALRKLDFLMEKYLHFALKEAQFSNYVANLLDEIDSELDSKNQARLRALMKGISRPPKVKGAKLIFEDQGSALSQHEWVKEAVELIQEHYSGQLADLDAQIAGEQVFATKRIMEKRREVIARRQEFVGRITDILTNLNHQMQLMADAFGLINDEIRARSPEQVLADIDEVVSQTNSLTLAIEEMTPIDDLTVRLSHLPSSQEVEAAEQELKNQ